MRIKTLLIAAAALAVGVISSEAQVYSQNIVGYANVAGTLPNAYYMLECPFNVGVSNGANEVFGTNLPDTSQILTWDADTASFTTYIYDGTAIPGVYWYNADESAPVNPPILLPGQGFYLNSIGAGFTNTFAGTVAVTSPGTNISAPFNAATFYMVGCIIPYEGFVTNVVAGTSQGVNLNGLPDTSQVLIWDVPSQSFVTYVYDTAAIPGVFWYNGDESAAGPCPSLTVGQAFYLQPLGNTYNWTTSLP